MSDRPLKVALVVGYFHEGKFGGAELWCREVALGLQRRGHEVVVVTSNLTRHQSAFEAKAPRAGKAWGLPVRRHRISLLAGLAAKPAGFYPIVPGILLDRALGEADVVMVSGIEDPSSALGAVGARLRGKPVLVNPHTHMNLVRTMGPDRRIPLALMEGMPSCYFHFNTEREQPFWRARVDTRRVLPAVGCGVHPLPPGFDVPRAEARKQLGIPPEQRVLLFLGRLTWGKGIPRAVAAVDGLRDLQAHLYLVGFAEQSTAKDRGRRVSLPAFLRERWPRAPYTLVGDVDERRKHLWLAASDALVLPSLHESFGIVFLEAWQHGLPVLGWDEGGMPAVVRDGVDGFIVGSIPDLRDRMATLLAKPDLAAQLGGAGQRDVLQRFGWDAVVERVERNLRLVLALEEDRRRGLDTSDEIRELG